MNLFRKSKKSKKRIKAFKSFNYVYATALFLSDDDKELARVQNLQKIQKILENFAK